jgi:hypothetical protein
VEPASRGMYYITREQLHHLASQLMLLEMSS